VTFWFLTFLFGHNLCYKYLNGSCEPILDIYISRVFQWCNEIFNPMNLSPWNISLKIQNSMGISIPKVGVHLGVYGFICSHSWKCKCDSWVALLACTFSCFLCGCKPKVRGVIIDIEKQMSCTKNYMLNVLGPFKTSVQGPKAHGPTWSN
jgi:hypothetical protein